MTTEVLRWRPTCKRAIDAVAEQARACIEAWLADWCSSPPQCRARCSDIPKGGTNPSFTGTALPLASRWLDARMSDSVQIAIARYALGVHESATPAPDTGIPADILDRVSAEIVADLVVRMHAILDTSDAESTAREACSWRHGGVALEFDAPRIGRLLTLRLAREYFWPRITHSPAHASRPVLGDTVRSAMQDNTVSVRVPLGICELSASELLEMSPGDLLMLSRGPEDDVELQLEHRDQSLSAFARGVLGRTGSRFAVQLTRMETL